MANAVIFKAGLSTEYKALAAKSVNTFYYTTDDKMLYLGEQLLTDHANVEEVKQAIENLTAAQVEYKAAADGKAAQSVKDALDELIAAVGEGGAVADQITAAIETLDATVSIADEDNSNPLNITIVETDGKLTSVMGSIDANTFDTYGAANTAKSQVIGAEGDAATADTIYGAKAAAAAAKTAADNAQSAADAAQGDVDALETLVGTGYGENKTVKEYIDDAQAAATYDDTALTARVQANEDAITLLNKTDGTAGSVKKTVDDAIAAVVADAPEDFNTLKEISDWISGHSSDAASMNSQIQENKRNIEALDTEIGDKKTEKTAATGLYKYVDDAVSGENARATGVESGLDTRIQALEAKAGDDSVEDQIAVAIEELDVNEFALATVASNVVTIKSIKETDGKIEIGVDTTKDITLEEVAYTGAAADVSIADAGNYTTQTTVEGAIQELYQGLTWQTIA